jgi:rhodanese-related sulfurtransferase
MYRNLRRLTLALLATALLFACSAPAPVADAPKEQPVPQDPALIISLAEVQALVAKGAEGNFILVDSRPEVKFQQAHIPGAISIPKPLIEQNLDKLAKDKQVIFYCGGVTCALSSKSAEVAQKNGYSNVKVFYAGMPAWEAGGNFVEIELPALQKLVAEGGKEPFVLIDSRPSVKYAKGHIPGAISLPKAEFELKKGILPADKNIQLIFYCGGYECKLSAQSATLALGLGYKNVAVFSAGEPVWKSASLPLWGSEASGAFAKKEKPADALPEAITAEELQKLIASGQVQIVDVREPEEFAKAHIKGAINIFDEDFIFKAKESVAKLVQSGRVVLVCATGARSASAYYAILDSEYVNKNNVQYLDNKVSYLANGTFVVSK